MFISILFCSVHLSISKDEHFKRQIAVLAFRKSSPLLSSGSDSHIQPWRFSEFINKTTILFKNRRNSRFYLMPLLPLWNYVPISASALNPRSSISAMLPDKWFRTSWKSARCFSLYICTRARLSLLRRCQTYVADPDLIPSSFLPPNVLHLLLKTQSSSSYLKFFTKLSYVKSLFQATIGHVF